MLLPYVLFAERKTQKASTGFLRLLRSCLVADLADLWMLPVTARLVAVLSQEFEGVEHPIVYVSRKLSLEMHWRWRGMHRRSPKDIDATAKDIFSRGGHASCPLSQPIHSQVHFSSFFHSLWHMQPYISPPLFLFGAPRQASSSSLCWMFGTGPWPCLSQRPCQHCQHGRAVFACRTE